MIMPKKRWIHIMCLLQMGMDVKDSETGKRRREEFHIERVHN